jgi:hypothetical protein
VASGVIGDSQEGVRDTLQIIGFFGLIVGSVMQMRAVAQLLRDDPGRTSSRRV